MAKVKLLLTGGFLGSGKTTAIRHAAQYLQQQGTKTGVITNDQGTQQVDTRFIHSGGIPVEEVANGCFCCRYADLEKSIDVLKSTGQVEVVLAESVGSCADLAATVVNPLLQYHPGGYEVVLSVFADVRLLLTFLQNGKRIFFDTVNYIYQKQLEEADVIVVNKIDLLTPEDVVLAQKIIAAEYRGKIILYQNSLSEESIQQWLSVVLDGAANPGQRPTLLIDYDTYGAGEAEMAWLDEEIGIVTNNGTAFEAAHLLMDNIYQAITQQGYPIGHVKFFLDDGTTQRKISYTTVATSRPANMGTSKAARAVLLINARVQTEPALLLQLVTDAIIATEQATPCKILENTVSCFKPGYPTPTHRIVG